MASLPADRAPMDETRSFLGHGHEDTPVEDVGPFNPYTPSTESSRPAYNEPATPVKGTRTHRLSLRVVFSTVIVFVGTAGIASALLGWLIIHKTQPTITKVWQDGAFLLDEGERTEGGLRSGRLLGLTISSAASTVLSLTTPVIMGLYAFRIAQNWLDHVRQMDLNIDHGQAELPTPLQYGLLVEVLGATSIASLISTTRYFLRSSTRRSRASTMLKKAFVVGLFVFLLSHATSGVDLWLHTSTSTVLFTTFSPTETQNNFSISQSQCPPYPDPFYDAIHPCLYGAGYWGAGVDSLAPGMQVSSNSSDALQVITINNASDMAVIVVSSIPQLLKFDMETYGARASCQSVTPLCSVNTSLTCEGFPSSFVPFDFSKISDSEPANAQSQVHLQTSSCEGCDHVDTSAALASDDVGTLNTANPPPLNAYSTWMEFVWVSDGDDPVYTAKASNALLMPQDSNTAVMFTNCSLAFYNVTLTYLNGSYSVVNEVLSNTGLSDGLAAPTRLGHYLSRLVANVEGRVFNDNNSDSVMAFLSQDFARLALGSAATITNETIPSVSTVYQISDQILGRYPVWPIFIFLALLYIYSAAALIILVQATIFSRDMILQVPSVVRKEGEKGRTVSALELTQLRLTSPLSLAATLYASDRSEMLKAELSMKTSLLDAFDEQPGEERLAVGFADGEKDLETQWRSFGVWKRHGRQSESSDTL